MLLKDTKGKQQLAIFNAAGFKKVNDFFRYVMILDNRIGLK